jgi:hypothetical protein
MLIEKSYHTGINPTTINFWLDLGLLAIFLSAIASAFLTRSIHPWMGASMAAGVLIHFSLHWKWIAATAQRILKPMPIQVRVKALVDALMLIDFILLALSGGIVSLIYAPRVTSFHAWCMYTLITLIAIHLAFNWKWLYTKIVKS